MRPPLSTVRFAILAALAALTCVAMGAQAASVTCESRDKRREDCRLRGSGEIVLKRQLSHTKCVKGRNWDETRSGLYVTDGCGGVFEARGGGWSDERPGHRPDDRPDHRPGDRPGERPGDRPNDRPGDRPGPSGPSGQSGMGGLRDSASQACAMRFNNEGNGAPTVQIDGERRLASDQWELLLRIDGRRYACRVDGRGRVLGFNPA